MWGTGDAHGQRDRIIDSKVVSSEQLADLYLMYKDHKPGQKSRPVVTGCNSNTRGFSNCVSDLLESVNKANENPYETISTEDKLARVEQFNQEARKIMAEGRAHLKRKIMCSKENVVAQLSRCNKLWKNKSKQERKTARSDEDSEDEDGSDEDEAQDEEEEDEDPNCEEEIEEELMRYRIHQYLNNPNMELSGEDAQSVLDCDHCGPLIFSI